MTRIVSTATTGGLGNPIVSTAEAGGSIILSILALTLPVVAVIVVVVIIFFASRKIYRWLARRNKLQAQHE
ncbi:MAG: DUF4126 domain-containing protein [Candidatus Dadabacteria bacterium]|nr:MAG: DUF4126 domain-containing protein [Candidatus Dadabacteria bacterium]